MLHPSYNELMEFVNENAGPQEDGEPLVQSRYTLVMAAAKRARQIVNAKSKVETNTSASEKPLSIAVKELYSGEVRILGKNEEPEPVIREEHKPEEEAGDENTETADEETPAEGTEEETAQEESSPEAEPEDDTPAEAEPEDDMPAEAEPEDVPQMNMPQEEPEVPDEAPQEASETDE